jgi:hypothetical protein
MVRSPDSPQTVWQAKFQEYPLVPFDTHKFKRSLRYYDLTSIQFWWHNPVNPNSLRLTAGAWTILKTCKVIPHWKFKLPKGLLPRTYLQLEKHFSSPYYIPSVDHIIVFNDRDSMMLALHGSDLQQYLDNHDSQA